MFDIDRYLESLSPAAREAVQRYINTPPEQQHLSSVLTVNLTLALAYEKEKRDARTTPDANYYS